MQVRSFTPPPCLSLQDYSRRAVLAVDQSVLQRHSELHQQERRRPHHSQVGDDAGALTLALITLKSSTSWVGSNVTLLFAVSLAQLMFLPLRGLLPPL